MTYQKSVTIVAILTIGLRATRRAVALVTPSPSSGPGLGPLLHMTYRWSDNRSHHAPPDPITSLMNLWMNITRIMDLTQDPARSMSIPYFGIDFQPWFRSASRFQFRSGTMATVPSAPDPFYVILLVPSRSGSLILPIQCNRTHFLNNNSTNDQLTTLRFTMTTARHNL